MIYIHSNQHRNAIGAYVDLEANITQKFLASAAVRGEHYSDFGNDLSGKLAGRYDFVDAFALRASVQHKYLSILNVPLSLSSP